MANKKIAKLDIDSDRMQKEIAESGLSIRGLADCTSYSERTIRSYLKQGMMPEKLIKEIDDALRPKKHLIHIWSCNTVMITDEELIDIMGEARIEDDEGVFIRDLELPREVGAPFQQKKNPLLLRAAGRETYSYIPRQDLEIFNDWYLEKKKETNK